MVIHPNKPIIFSVVHEPPNVEAALEEFKKAIQGKKVLFIELMQKSIDQILVQGKYNFDLKIKSYQRLCLEAHQAGLRVIPLDIEAGDMFDVDFRSHGRSRISYQLFHKREKHWSELLRNAESNSVAVMHPTHALEIARLLKLPKENILGDIAMRGPSFLLQREVSELERIRIEKERLERNRRRAIARARKPLA
ncbi:MAG: hypothetical protein PHD95_02180 [Candidatus ainarchaeum sp.]|nr:hypothetical protein [Candidatus ainarchaeum sp.]